MIQNRLENCLLKGKSDDSKHLFQKQKDKCV